MYTINVHYFALLREKSGVEHEQVFSAAKNFSELYEELSKKYSFDLPSTMIQVAVNDEFSSLDKPLSDQVKVVFIPPVAGG
jgi:molybdopterin synthase sulfur carrier subunit